LTILLQLRYRFQHPDLRSPIKGNSHNVALAAELMLLRKELAAKPRPADSSFKVVDNCGTFFIDDEVKAYYNRTFKEQDEKLEQILQPLRQQQGQQQGQQQRQQQNSEQEARQGGGVQGGDDAAAEA
jgi:hypothetical protein